MHGILMHNDEEQGEEHKAEDQYLRFKEAMKTKRPEFGPNDADTEFHGVLMHGDHVSGHVHEETQEMLPELKTNAGPQDLNEALHELMHGEEGVHKHEHDKKKEEGIQSPPNAEQLMHGLLIHGDATHTEHHTEDAEAINTEPAGPEDASEYLHGVLMHGDAEPGKHHEHHTVDTKDTNTEPAGPQHAEEYMHGVIMHGDDKPGQHHEHPVDDDADSDDNRENEDVPKDTDSKPAGPQDAEEYMHGVLMHGDSEPGHHHDFHGHRADDKADNTENFKGPDTPESLFHGILMHGDSEIGHDHSEEHTENAKKEVFRDITKILEMELGEDLLKNIDIEKLLHRDESEYNDYLKTRHEDEATSTSTYAKVSDGLLRDIERMKNKYLSKLEEDIEVVEKDDSDFTIEDTIAVLDAGVETHGHDDMRHDLELIGNTDPINARHKVFKELREAESKEHK